MQQRPFSGIKLQYSDANLSSILLDHTSRASVESAAERFKSNDAAPRFDPVWRYHGGIMAVAYETTTD